MKTLALIFSLLVSSSLFAAEKGGVKLDDKMTVAGKELVLNGIGIRRATIFNVHVYVGGLYLQEKTQDPAKVIAAPNPKHITMKFVRSVDADDLQGAWLEGFEAAVKEDVRKPMMEAFNKFNATMQDVEEGDAMEINFLDQGVQISVKGQKHPFIGDAKFSQALLSIWFINARDEELRDELLGKK